MINEKKYYKKFIKRKKNMIKEKIQSKKKYDKRRNMINVGTHTKISFFDMGPEVGC